MFSNDAYFMYGVCVWGGVILQEYEMLLFVWECNSWGPAEAHFQNLSVWRGMREEQEERMDWPVSALG